MTKEAAIRKFDAYLSSNFSTVLSFFWRSGIAIFIAGLVYTNLCEQRKTHDVIVHMKADQAIYSDRQEYIKVDLLEVRATQEKHADRISKVEREHDALRRYQPPL